MRHEQVTLKKLAELPPALSVLAGRQDAQKQALQALGRYAPVFISADTHRVLNSPYLEALTTLYSPNTTVDVLFLDIPESREAIAAMVLCGGLDGKLAPQVDARQAVEIIYALQDIHPERINALGIGLDYAQWILDMEAYGQSQEPQPRPPGVTPAPVDLSAVDLGMPQLNPELQQLTTMDFKPWGQRDRTLPGTAFHFYTNDYRFSNLIQNPGKLIDTRPLAIIEPNFSSTPTTPPALALADIYHKRTLAARWQAAGIRVVVDLNVSRRLATLNLLGVPEGWRAYANRAYTDDLSHLDEAAALARARAGGDISYFVVGRQQARALCEARGWFWISSEVAYGTP